MKRHYMPVTADVPGVSEGQRALIRKVIRTALAAERVDFPCEVDVRVTNDDTIHQINREMRQVDRATDVLSFPMFDLTPGELPDPEMDADPGTGLVPLGDMVISWEHVAAQAKEYGHSNRRELAYLVVHSVLHLLGYDHLDEGVEKARMRAREEKGLDGGEFQAFFIALQSVEAQLVMHQVKVEAVIALRGGVQLGLDIVGVKPYHEIRHKKPPFKALNFCSVQENNNTKKMRC